MKRIRLGFPPCLAFPEINGSYNISVRRPEWYSTCPQRRNVRLAREHSGTSHHRRHSVKADFSRAVFDSHTLGAVSNGGFKGMILGHSSSRTNPGRRCDLNKDAGSLLLEKVWEDNVCRQVDRFYVNVHNEVEIFIRHLRGGLIGVRCANIVNNNIEPAVLLKSRLQEPVPVFSLGHIATVDLQPSS